MADENREMQEEEIAVMESIFGDDFVYLEEERSCQLRISCSEPRDSTPETTSGSVGDPHLSLKIHLPPDYPQNSAPIAEVYAPWIRISDYQRIYQALEEISKGSFGDVVMFKWADWFKDQEWLWDAGNEWQNEKTSFKQTEPENQAEGAPKSSKTSQTQATTLQESNHDAMEIELHNSLGIIHGEPFTVKKSTFQAHLAPVINFESVQAAMDALIMNKKVSAATHNIMAFRIKTEGKNTLLEDCDDDGENAAGGRLLHLLKIVDATNVLVVVSRWFGGVLLGPDRFKYINNVARSLLDRNGYIGPKKSKK